MAEVPSVPSLRNLVASSVMTKSRRNSSDNPIKRNFSTKSFSKYDTNTKEEAPIRKCETVIALSGKILKSFFLPLLGHFQGRNFAKIIGGAHNLLNLKIGHFIMISQLS